MSARLLRFVLLIVFGMTMRSSIAGQSVLFSPDGKLIALGQSDGSIELRDAESGKHFATVNQQATNQDRSSASSLNMQPSFAFSMDGKVLASTSGSEPVTLWDVEIQAKLRSLDQASVGYDLEFSPDGKLLAGIGLDGIAGPYRLTLWSTATGQAIMTWTLVMNLKKRDNAIRRLVFSSDSATLMVEVMIEGRSLLQIWETENGEQRFQVEADQWSMSPDGTRVVVLRYGREEGESDRRSLYQISSGRVIAKF